MEEIIKKIEGMVEKKFTEFETHPVRTTIVFLVFLFLAKKVYLSLKKW